MSVTLCMLHSTNTVELVTIAFTFYHQSLSWATIVQKNFTLKIIRVKMFVLIYFRALFDPWNFFNGWRLQYGWVPWAFLVFSLPPGIGRARYPRCNTVAVRSSCREVWMCAHAYSLIITMYAFIHVKFLQLVSTGKFFSNKFFPIYGMLVWYGEQRSLY